MVFNKIQRKSTVLYTVRKENGVLRNRLLMAQKKSKQFLTVKKLKLRNLLLTVHKLGKGISLPLRNLFMNFKDIGRAEIKTCIHGVSNLRPSDYHSCLLPLS
jgi:hypothetical protein